MIGDPLQAAAISAEVLFAVDGDQRIVAWNGTAAETFGYDRRSALGSFCYQVVGGCDESGTRFCRAGCPVVFAAAQGRPTPPFKLKVRTRGGPRVPVDVSTIVLVEGGGAGTVIHLCRPLVNGHAARRDEGADFGLTTREREILACLCRGDKTDGIAASLGISETTVRNHVQHLLDKLAVHSRAEAVALAFHGGLL